MLYCLKGALKDLIISVWDFAVSTLNIFWIFGYSKTSKLTLEIYVSDLSHVAYHSFSDNIIS